MANVLESQMNAEAAKWGCMLPLHPGDLELPHLSPVLRLSDLGHEHQCWLAPAGDL